jgi:hypothetical protein
MSARKKTRKNAGEGYGYMFHGSFGTKAKAVAKEKKTKGAWVKGVLTNKGHRYLVMSPRLNPIKRKKKNPATKVHKKFRTSEQAYAFANQMRAKYPGRKVDVLERSTGKWEVFVLNEPTHNPHELLVLGANPEHSSSNREITLPAGSTLTIRMNPTEARQNVELGTFENGVFHPWTRRPKSRQKEAIRRQNPENPDRFTSAHAIAKGITRQAPGLIQTKRQKRVAGMVRSARKHKYEWIPSEGVAPGMNPRQNPAAADLREEFIGEEPDWIDHANEPNMPKGDYAKLGDLVALSVKPMHGGQVKGLFWTNRQFDIVHFGDELLPLIDAPWVTSDESARQIYFYKGLQNLHSQLGEFGARSRGDGVFELGQVRVIRYRAKKWTDDFKLFDFVHRFGEETGVLPMLLFDDKHQRLLFEGGEYQIRREGIVN